MFNEKEVQQYVEWLSGIGADPTGGTTRLLYDEHWVKAQNELKTLFEKHDFKTQYDAVGNLFARIEGSEFRRRNYYVRFTCGYSSKWRRIGWSIWYFICFSSNEISL